MVDRILLIIEHLARHEGGQTLADLVRTTGLPKSSLHRLVNRLVDEKAVIREKTRYQLCTRLWRIGSPRGGRDTADLRRLLMPHLIELHRKTGLVVSLAVLDPPEILVVELLYGHDYTDLVRRLPHRAPAHRTAAGKILMAMYGDPGTDQPESALTAHDVASRAELERQLAASRASGLAVSRGGLMPGLQSIAAPVTGHDGRPVAALALSAPAAHMNMGSTLGHLRRAAYNSSLALRCRGASAGMRRGRRGQTVPQPPTPTPTGA